MKTRLFLAAGGVFLSAFFLFLAIAAFYLEEDWRGAETWTRARAEIEAQGISLDRRTYVAKAPPEAQNFAETPLLQATQETNYPFSWRATNLEQALPRIASQADATTKVAAQLPYLKAWKTGDLDLAAVKEQLVLFGQNLKSPVTIPPGASTTTAFEMLCPALPELRSENQKRPVCVFPRLFDREPPYAPTFGPATSLIKLNKVLVYEERLAIEEHNPSLALDDMDIAWKLVIGFRQQPTLISGIMATALIQMQLPILEEGLDKHLFDEGQLIRIGSCLKDFDLLAGGQYWVTGDVIDFDLPYSRYYRKHRYVSLDELEILRGRILSGGPKPTWISQVLFWLIPDGWFDQDNAAYARAHLLGTRRALAPEMHRVYPEIADFSALSLGTQHSWVFWDRPLADNTLTFANSVKNFAFGQARMDEALIAVELEKYRLLHGAYPDSLAKCAVLLPHDVMDGEDDVYRTSPDGSFVLYSVGWNQNDDHGAGPQTSQVRRQDAPDWVWPETLAPESKAPTKTGH